jgi:hypothetical protein
MMLHACKVTIYPLLHNPTQLRLVVRFSNTRLLLPIYNVRDRSTATQNERRFQITRPSSRFLTRLICNRAGDNKGGSAVEQGGQCLTRRTSVSRKHGSHSNWEEGLNAHAFFSDSSHLIDLPQTAKYGNLYSISTHSIHLAQPSRNAVRQ